VDTPLRRADCSAGTEPGTLVESEAATAPVPATVTVAEAPDAEPETTLPDDEIVVPADELAAGEGGGCGKDEVLPPPPHAATPMATSATSAPIRNLSTSPPARIQQ